MYLDAILEVAIGLVFAWLVLSIGTMQVQEWISALLSLRARFLEQQLLNMLGSKDLVERFYTHPLIRSISPPGKKPGEVRRPSYIPAQRFAAALLKILSEGQPSSGASGLDIREGLRNLRQTSPAVAAVLEQKLPNLEASLERGELNLTIWRAELEEWFNDAMDRLSGAYKRCAQLWSLFIGLGLALLFNVDTVAIARQLWREPTLRQVIAQQAASKSDTDPSTGVKQVRQYVDMLGLPVGWSVRAPAGDEQCGWQLGKPVYPAVWVGGECRLLSTLPRMDDLWGWLSKIIGILLSGLAATQGAPFWFDVLQRLVNLRSAGPVPSAPPKVETTEEKPPKSEEPVG
ncbi:MAG: hypothetical protein J7555_01405 [Chloroflexi bacterium]|nr:hypothetical protein [Chloroflexota bacterium]